MLVIQNVHVGSGIANGTLARLLDVQLKPSAVVRFVTASEYGGGVHEVGASDVSLLGFEHLSHKPDDEQQFPGLPRDCFPIKTLRAPAITMGSSRFCPRQFPVMQAHALTGHKCQGATLLALVVGAWGNKINNHDGWL